MTYDPGHVWCRNVFNMLAEEGVWAVPRSGLVFTRRGDKLVLTAQMPHDESMPISAAELLVQQHGDFQAIQDHFAEAGIDVERGV